MQLCEAPPWPTDPVIVVDARRASQFPHRLASSAAVTAATLLSFEMSRCLFFVELKRWLRLRAWREPSEPLSPAI